MLDPRTVTRRSFMRRVLGAGVGLLSLEFLGGSLAFLWPNITEGLGARIRVGRLPEIVASHPPSPGATRSTWRPRAASS